ncbi:hypothetical protein L0F63_006116 [Massospora cicadina]|nr:hypothetical protein L0F63_006116 [Massospora cicadina]
MDLSTKFLTQASISNSPTRARNFSGIVELSSTEVRTCQPFKARLEAIYAATAIPGTIFNPTPEVGSHPDLEAWRLEVVQHLTELAEMVRTETFDEIENRSKALSVVKLSREVFDSLFIRADRNSLDQHLVRNLLNNHVRSKFASQAPRPAISFSEPSAIDKAKDHSHLGWKTEDGRCEATNRLGLTHSGGSLVPHLELVVPPALVVVYDYEVKFRLVGIQFLVAILKQTPRRQFESRGLVDVFGEAGREAILSISQKPNHSAGLEEGMLASKGDLASRRWLLTREAELMRLTGPYLVAYLQKFVDAACLGLELPEFSHTRLNPDLPLLSCKVLRELFVLGSPRIAAYSSRILVAIARCWVYICQDPRRDSAENSLELEIKKLLDDTYNVGDKDVIEKGLVALRDADPSMFGPLLDHVLTLSSSTSQS